MGAKTKRGFKERIMKLVNVFEIEQKIKAQFLLDNLFAPEMIFTSKSESELSNKNFKPLNDADAVGVVILYEGFDPFVSSQSGKVITQKLLVLCRILVVSPESLYYDNAGVKFIEVIHSMRRLNKEACLAGEIVKDTHEHHLPDYTNNMVALPQLWQFEVII